MSWKALLPRALQLAPPALLAAFEGRVFFFVYGVPRLFSRISGVSSCSRTKLFMSISYDILRRCGSEAALTETDFDSVNCLPMATVQYTSIRVTLAHPRPTPSNAGSIVFGRSSPVHMGGCQARSVGRLPPPSANVGLAALMYRSSSPRH